MGLFSRKHDGMPDVGQGDGWTKSEWKRARRERVLVDKLESTNRGHYLDPKLVEKAARGRGKDSYVIEHKGRYYVADGHHNAAGAAARGDRTVNARVIHV